MPFVLDDFVSDVQKRARIRLVELLEQADVIAAEAETLRKILDATGWEDESDQKPELESGTKNGRTPERKPAQKPGTTPRPAEVSLENVRATIQQNWPAPVPFSSADVIVKLGTTRATQVSSLIRWLVNNGELAKEGHSRSTRYRLVLKPQPQKPDNPQRQPGKRAKPRIGGVKP